jgi:hypothetical protein
VIVRVLASWTNAALNAVQTLLSIDGAASAFGATYPGRNRRVRISVLGGAVWLRLSSGTPVTDATAGAANEILVKEADGVVMLHMPDFDNLSVIPETNTTPAVSVALID